MALVAATAQISDAQQGEGAETSSAPENCLVLSGGGARGGAHVGVLRVLEELRVPVDFIVGTSIGSIFGGLYASGLSPQEMESTILQVDWRSLFSDRPPRQAVPFRRKQDDRLPLFRFELGITRKGLTLPSGLIAGRKVSFLLRNLTLGAAGIEDFDDLPVPFRAVATDLGSGEAVVLQRGDLARAIRASMSVPAALSPVEIDGRVLVDGGIAMNLPVEVAVDRGCRRIIAVDVSEPLEELEEELSAVAVLVRSLDFLTIRNVEQQRDLLRSTDVLIVPELTLVSFSDFDELESTIGLGETATRQHARALAALSVSEEAFERYLSRRQRSAEKFGVEGLPITSIEISGQSRVHPRLIRSRIRTEAGEPLELETLRHDLGRIYEIGEFEQVDFRLFKEEAGHRLLIDPQDKTWGPHYLRFGLRLEGDLEGQGSFSALAQYTRTQLNRLGAEWKNILAIGERQGLFSELYQPVSYSGLWFVAPRIELRSEEEQALVEEGSLTRIDFSRYQGQLDLGIQPWRYGEVRVGVFRGQVEAEVGEPQPERERIDLAGFAAQVTLDQLDNVSFPRQGALGELEVILSRPSLGADESYNKLSLRLLQAVSAGRHTFLGAASLGTDLGSEIPFYDEFFLGGFFNLSGLERRQLQGDAFTLLQLAYYYRLARLPGASAEGLYLGGALEAGNVWQDHDAVDFGDLHPGFLLFGGADTQIGPVYLGYGRTDGGHDAFYLILGQQFR